MPPATQAEGTSRASAPMSWAALLRKSALAGGLSCLRAVLGCNDEEDSSILARIGRQELVRMIIAGEVSAIDLSRVMVMESERQATKKLKTGNQPERRAQRALLCVDQPFCLHRQAEGSPPPLD